jgi:predicted MFS family arabinose efflux permease
MQHDIAYERKVLVLMGLGFGLVGLDRWMIAPLFPAMMAELGLDFQQLGSLIGMLGFTWGVVAIVSGRLADAIGRKRILVITMVAFSLLSGLSGLAMGFASLLMIRAVMGVAEGAFTPASVAATGEASRPQLRGFNQGLQLSMFSLIGLGLGPIIVTQLLGIVPSWHWVFLLSTVPGLVIAFFIARTMKNDTPAKGARGKESVRWLDLLKSRNVLLACLGILCAMAGIFVMSAMVPVYLTEVLKLSPAQMGFVTSAIGFGGFVGAFGIPAASDRIGRKPAAIASFVGASLFVSLFQRTGADPALLFGMLFLASMFALGLLSLITGPIATEGAPAGLIASAVGLVSGVGEVIGGGLSPVIAGYLAQHFGLPSVLSFAFYGFVCGIVVSLFFEETSPVRLQARAAAAVR